MKAATELAHEIEDWLDRYVRGQISAGDLLAAIDSMAPRLADLTEEDYALWAADHLEILFAEISRGDRSEHDVRELIRAEMLLPRATTITASSTVASTDTFTPEPERVGVAA